MVKDILQNNIYGVDLNEESVEITKLSLWLKTAEKGKQLADLDKNIKCGNSLIDDESVAGKKTFKREIQFNEIMKNGGFHIVAGNPPYVRVQNLDEKSR
jgi:type II restriction/modification system DNA methylase subunit YeeA